MISVCQRKLGLDTPYHDCPIPCAIDFRGEIASITGIHFYGLQKCIQILDFPIIHHHHLVRNIQNLRDNNGSMHENKYFDYWQNHRRNCCHLDDNH